MFLHQLGRARNQHGRHGTTEFFHASVLLQTQSTQSEMETLEKIVVLCTISQARIARLMMRFNLSFARKQNAPNGIHQHKLL